MSTINNTNIDEVTNSLQNYNIIDGYTLGCTYEKLKHLIDNFKVRDNDVWVTSFPRSGTTWTQEMVWLIVNNFNYDDAKRPLNERFPYLDAQTQADWEMLESCKDIKFPHYMPHSIEHAMNDKSLRRCIKTHLPFDLLPIDIKDRKKQAKIIHVMRNPKDVFISYYYHPRVMQLLNNNFDEFKTRFLHDKLWYCPYWKLINSYWKRKNDPNILIIKYEDMRSDLESVILMVANFLNTPIRDDELNKLKEHLSFKSMHNNASINFKEVVEMKDASVKSDLHFIRKGVVGDYKNMMTPETIVEFDRWIAENNEENITI